MKCYVVVLILLSCCGCTASEADLRKAAQPGNGGACYELGKHLLVHGKSYEGYHWYSVAAVAGNKQALAALETGADANESWALVMLAQYWDKKGDKQKSMDYFYEHACRYPVEFSNQVAVAYLFGGESVTGISITNEVSKKRGANCLLLAAKHIHHSYVVLLEKLIRDGRIDEPTDKAWKFWKNFSALCDASDKKLLVELLEWPYGNGLEKYREEILAEAEAEEQSTTQPTK